MALHPLCRLIFVATLALAACACSAELAPVPYPAARIHEATASGRGYLFRLESPGAPTKRMRMRFDAVDDSGAALVRTEWAEADPEPAPTAATRVTWQELEAHAHYPRDRTTITSESVQTPAGIFPCKLYTVNAGDGTTTRAWFAVDLPGAPVRMEISKGNKLVLRMLLLQHLPG